MDGGEDVLAPLPARGDALVLSLALITSTPPLEPPCNELRERAKDGGRTNHSSIIPDLIGPIEQTKARPVGLNVK